MNCLKTLDEIPLLSAAFAGKQMRRCLGPGCPQNQSMLVTAAAAAVAADVAGVRIL